MVLPPPNQVVSLLRRAGSSGLVAKEARRQKKVNCKRTKKSAAPEKVLQQKEHSRKWVPRRCPDMRGRPRPVRIIEPLHCQNKKPAQSNKKSHYKEAPPPAWEGEREEQAEVLCGGRQKPRARARALARAAAGLYHHHQTIVRFSLKVRAVLSSECVRDRVSSWAVGVVRVRGARVTQKRARARSLIMHTCVRACGGCSAGML